MRISDWSSDVCSSDLHALYQVALDRGVGAPFDTHRRRAAPAAQQHVDDRVDQRTINGQQAVIVPFHGTESAEDGRQIGRASCRERVGRYVSNSVVDVSSKKTKKGQINIQQQRR